MTINRVDNEITAKQVDVTKSNDITKTNIQNNSVVKEKEIPIIVCDNVKTNTKDVVFNDNSKFLAPDKVPLISQRSLDFVVDSLTNEAKSDNEKVTVSLKKIISNIDSKIVKVVPKCYQLLGNKHRHRILPKQTEPEKHNNALGEYEVFIKLPNGKQVRMKPVEDQKESNTKEILRNNILKKSTFNKLQTTKSAIKKTTKTTKLVANVLKIPTGTLIPVTLVNQEGAPLSNDDLSKVPITKIDNVGTLTKISVAALTNVTKKASKPITKPAKTVATRTSPVIAKGTLIPIINTPKISNVRSLASTAPDTKDTPTLAVPKTNITNETYKTVTDTDVQLIPTITTLVTKADTSINLACNEVFFDQEDLNKVSLTKSPPAPTNTVATAEDDDSDDDCVIEEITNNPEIAKRTKFELKSRCAASKRYR